ncbi:MAG: FAD-dependent oxidoreductase [Thermoguttaceae bacterium]
MRYLMMAILTLFSTVDLGAAEAEYDVVIYGGTSGGVAAAVQARRMGKSVVLIEPTERLGGLTSGGLGQTDIGNKAAIGGVAREFYRAIRRHYDAPTGWKWQPRQEYMDSGQTRTASGEDTMWTFEPSAALAIYQQWVKEHGVDVVYGERLDRRSGVATTATVPWRILSIGMESGRVFRGKMFLDATYEGDLMAAARVGYTVGREANSQYGETLNGVQTAQARFHQFLPGVDPYVEKGKSQSGLLPFLDPAGPGQEGTGDRRVQAYCFRMCLTDHPDNRIPFEKPEGYDPQWYELLLRNFEAGEKGMPWINSSMPNRKTDTNNRTGFSTDFIGQNYDYPEASYRAREEIVLRHRLYQQGLMWTLANHPRVPDAIRNEVARWGMCRDEFIEGGGWQDQLYVREARRMVGQYVMTQNNCQGREVADDPVGLGAYGMDSHNTQRYVSAEGDVRNEGDVEVGGFSPYPVSYRSIVPKTEECSNLLVPVCLSATHIAYGSIRMEPVFMVLGQSAATAAVHAIEENVAVQGVNYGRLKERLLADGQILEWTGPKLSGTAAGIKPQSLPGIVIDDDQAELDGFASTGNVVGPYVGGGYRHDADQDKGRQSATFKFTVEKTGRYEIRIAYPVNPNRATNVPVVVRFGERETTVRVNQRETPKIDRLFHPLGRFELTDEEACSVVISNEGTAGHVMVDAVQVVPVDQ